MGRGALNDSDIIAVLVEVLSDVMAGVAATDNKGLFAFRVRLDAFKLAGVAEFALKVVYALNLRHLHFSAMTSCLDDMAWMEGALLHSTVGLLSFQGYIPLPLARIPISPCEIGLRPDI